MSFHYPANRAALDLAPGAQARTFWGENMTFSIVELDANSLVPTHTHPHEQGGIVFEGEVEMSIAGEARILKVGEGYMIPGDVEHWARTGNSPAKVLDVFSPVREEFKY